MKVFTYLNYTILDLHIIDSCSLILDTHAAQAYTKLGHPRYYFTFWTLMQPSLYQGLAPSDIHARLVPLFYTCHMSPCRSSHEMRK